VTNLETPESNRKPTGNLFQCTPDFKSEDTGTALQLAEEYGFASDWKPRLVLIVGFETLLENSLNRLWGIWHEP
jgi:hypothetical protein